MRSWKYTILSIVLVIPTVFADQKVKQKVPGYVPNVAQGAKLYVEMCSSCHGTRGFADTPVAAALPRKPAVIGDPETLKRLSPQSVHDVLTKGISDRGMPSYRQLEEKERWDLAAYVFTLNSNFQKPTDNARSTIGWEFAKDQTDADIVDTLKKRGVPDNYIQKELSAIRFLLE